MESQSITVANQSIGLDYCLCNFFKKNEPINCYKQNNRYVYAFVLQFVNFFSMSIDYSRINWLIQAYVLHYYNFLKDPIDCLL